jgi:hypothetical protein
MENTYIGLPGSYPSGTRAPRPIPSNISLQMAALLVRITAPDKEIKMPIAHITNPLTALKVVADYGSHGILRDQLLMGPACTPNGLIDIPIWVSDVS